MNQAQTRTEQEYYEYLSNILTPSDLRKFRIPHATTPDYYKEYMERFGTDFFLNTIAAGQLPAEIALELNIPAMTMLTWIEENTAPEQRDRAREMCAESMVVKSTTVLTLLDKDATPAEVQMAREYSKRLAWTAERLNSDMWGPPKPSVVEAAPTFSITVNNAGNDNIEAQRDALRAKVIEHGPVNLETLKLLEG